MGQDSPQHRRANSRLPSLAVLDATYGEMYPAGTRGRRDRTFMGGECAACEESLELTLDGERIIQLMCGHISHEACFYEYIKEFGVQTCPSCEAPLSLDTSRGGASIDFQNLNRLVRSLQVSNERDDRSRTRSPISLPRAIEFSNRCSRTQNLEQKLSPPRDHLLPRKKAFACNQTEPPHNQTRSVKIDTSLSSTDWVANVNGSRPHDYDVQAMETSTTSPKSPTKSLIPSPTIIVRTEFPTITKSRQQQSLTCLVTVEVARSQWPSSFHDQGIRTPATPEPLLSKLCPPHSPILKPGSPVDSVHEIDPELDRVKDELFQRMDHWHGMEYAKFGNLLLHGRMRVGKDGQSWQDLNCYLFSDMLICVKARKLSPQVGQEWDDSEGSSCKARYALKGSILIKKHLRSVDVKPETATLTLNLSVVELPNFYLQFSTRQQLEKWHDILDKASHSQVPAVHETRRAQTTANKKQSESILSERTPANSHITSSPLSGSYGAGRSQSTVPTEYSNIAKSTTDLPTHVPSNHVPMDLVVVIPTSSSMQGLKSNLLRDTLRFLVSNLGEQDRMALVAFGSVDGCVPLVGMTCKTWKGWSAVLDSIRPMTQKHIRADAVEGTNAAMDLLVQRKSSNPLASILLISDSPSADHEGVNFVISRAEAAKISIHTFGLGLAHHPDVLVEMSTRTKASYTYVKDWMMLRECLAGCLGALQSSSHRNVKLKLRLPSGSPGKFVKISGGLDVTKRVIGRDVEISLGDLRFGDKRDVLVQLVIPPTTSSLDLSEIDPWSNVVAGLEALGGRSDHSQRISAEEIPLIQADLVWGDFLAGGEVAKLSHPSLLAITVLTPPPSTTSEDSRLSIPAIPPHPSIVQRRMELLSSDMLTRALSLVALGKHDRAQHLLAETRSILKGLAKGSLPPLPPPPSSALPATPPTTKHVEPSAYDTTPASELSPTPSPASSEFRLSAAPGIDVQTLLALDHELGASVEWISHPTIFVRDSRKAILQAVGVISTQRAFTFRTPAESLWATRIPGVQRMMDASGEWRRIADDDALTEEP